MSECVIKMCVFSFVSLYFEYISNGQSYFMNKRNETDAGAKIYLNK